MWVVRVGDDCTSAPPAARPAVVPAGAQPPAVAASEPGGIDVRRRFGRSRPRRPRGVIDAAYHAKYDRYGPSIVGHVTGPDAHAVTIRLLPATGQGDQP